MKLRIAKTVAASLLFGLVSGAAMADASIGVGISHGTSSSAATGGLEASRIYVPIKPASNNLWFEPYLSISNTSNKGTTRSIGLGTGIFVDFAKTQNTQAYYGGRIGLVNSSAPGGKSDTGIELAPAIGFGYLPAKNIMFGAEAGIALVSGDGTYIGTQTGLFARYFFD